MAFVAAKFFIAFLLPFIAAMPRGQHSRELILRQIFNEYYDPKISPYFATEEPTVVNVSMYIYSVDSIQESSMDFTVSMYLRQYWFDERLQYNASEYGNIEELLLDYKWLDEVWKPDLVFKNQKEAKFHTMTVPNKSLRIRCDGRLALSISLTITLAYTKWEDEFRLQWSDINNGIAFGKDDWNQFTIERFEPYVEIEEKDKFNTDIQEFVNRTWSVATAPFHVIRRSGFFVTNTLIPSSLLVVMSWVNFWIDHTAAPARISLCSVLVLAETTQIMSTNQQLPKVNYLKAIDVWNIAIFFFLFACMIEYAIVSVLARTKKRPPKRSELTTGPLPAGPAAGAPNLYGKRRATRLDQFCRLAFPLMFAAFCVLYYMIFAFGQYGERCK